ncbi:uncharacterized protein B0J16DRAFT_388886 [Fusarium flagelliforme]|uniref:uncharacterized protein n=1 Tax=Fusarium flagelliforme TaxID=2675880 RepID=UPI001E8CEA58|nr:uncharacterized protein B0J16DRAFT_388886 [Fusarium flagelliforme]KAH7175060.1 hypothetical protein B0J16DRAFT_388886 [Fusarium flagelliforme]
MEPASESGARENMSDSIIPGYQAGASLNLQVLDTPKSFMLQSVSNLSVKIEKVLSVTMAPVMLVTFDTPATCDTPGGNKRAVLKLFDRRFGSSLRRDPEGQHIPCRVEDEEAFKAFVLREQPVPFLRSKEERMKEEEEVELLSFLGASAWLDEPEEPEAQAKFELELWHESCEFHQTEVRAYNHLQDLQGVVIPRMFASVRIPRESGNSRVDYFFSPYGILLEYIDGPNLFDHYDEMASPAGLEELVQRAVDGAYQINERGLILNDSSPRNVAVDKQLNKPYIIDLAQCNFKEDFMKEELDEDLEEGTTHEDAWLALVYSDHNPSSIGTVMKRRLERDHGIEIEVVFPDMKKVLEYESRIANDLITTDPRRVRSYSTCSGPSTMINRGGLGNDHHGTKGFGAVGTQIWLEVWKRLRLAVSGGTTGVAKLLNWIRSPAK